MNKRLLLAFVGLCALSLAACSNTTKDSNKNTEETTKVSSTESPTDKKTSSESATKQTSSKDKPKEPVTSSETESNNKANLPETYNVSKSELLAGNYKSLDGTWENSHGYQLIFNNGTVTASIGLQESQQNFSLVKPTSNDNVIFLEFSPAPAPNGMSIMIALKETHPEGIPNDGTDSSFDRIIMGNNGGTLLFSTKENGGIPDTAYYRK